MMDQLNFRGYQSFNAFLELILIFSQFFAGLPYFEALQRWHSLEETRDIRLAFTSVETATIFLKFLISKSIDEALTIDDVVHLF